MSLAQGFVVDPDIEPFIQFEPLDLDSDRRDIQRRLVGPLSSIAFIKSIDHLNINHPDILVEAHAELAADFEQLGSCAVNYQEIAYSFVDVAKENIRSVISTQIQARTSTHSCDPYSAISKYQRSLFRGFVYDGDIKGRLKEGFDSQVNTSFNIILPGYLIAQYRLIDPKEVIECIKGIGLEGVASLMRTPAFIESMSRLAITASGMLRDGSEQYVDHPKKYLVLDPNSSLEDDDEVKFDEKKGGAVPAGLNIYGLYERQADIGVRLSEAANNILAWYLRLRNSTEPSKSFGGINGYSRGCPVVQRVAYVSYDDLTDEQWEDLTGGDNPIASYDSARQKLIFRRSVFSELNKLLAQVVDPLVV